MKDHCPSTVISLEWSKGAGLRQTRTKIFHVSPFIDMAARYHFRILPPGDVVRLRIHETDGAEPLLSATFAGERKPLSSAALRGLLLRIPLMTWKVIAGIHYEALKLWWKGARFHTSPTPGAPVSFKDRIKTSLKNCFVLVLMCLTRGGKERRGGAFN